VGEYLEKLAKEFEVHITDRLEGRVVKASNKWHNENSPIQIIRHKSKCYTVLCDKTAVAFFENLVKSTVLAITIISYRIS
jgi:hypothetical protein